MPLDSQEFAAFAQRLVRETAYPVLAEGYAALVRELRGNQALMRLAQEKGVDAVLASDSPEVARLKKGNKELVTSAEKIAEKRMADMVRETYGYAIVGEEHGYQPGSTVRCVFDPVDGTSAMIRTAMSEAFGIPLPSPAPAFGVTIGVVDEDEAVLGIVGELRAEDGKLRLANLWCGGRDVPLTCNGEPVEPPRPPEGLEAAGLSCTVPEIMFRTRERWGGYQALAEAAARSVPDQNCIGFMRLLQQDAGIHLAYEADLAYHDVAALVPILESAGMKVSDHEGQALRFPEEAIGQEFSILAAPPGLHAQALERVREGVAEEKNTFRDGRSMEQGYAVKFPPSGTDAAKATKGAGRA